MNNVSYLTEKELQSISGGEVKRPGLFAAGVLLVIGGAASLNPAAIVSGAAMILAS